MKCYALLLKIECIWSTLLHIFIPKQLWTNSTTGHTSTFHISQHCKNTKQQEPLLGHLHKKYHHNTACYSCANATVKSRWHEWKTLIGDILFANEESGCKWLNAVTDYILQYTYIMLPMGRIAEANRPKN